MEESRPTLEKCLNYVARLSRERWSAADLVALNRDAAEFCEEQDLSDELAYATLPDYLAAKCTLRELGIADDARPTLDGRIYISGPNLVRCAMRKHVACDFAWGLVWDGEVFDFEAGTAQRLQHRPGVVSEDQTLVAAWARGRAISSDMQYAVHWVPEVDPLGRILALERAIRRLLEQITANGMVVRACVLNDQYIYGSAQVHESKFPAWEELS